MYDDLKKGFSKLSVFTKVFVIALAITVPLISACFLGINAVNVNASRQKVTEKIESIKNSNSEPLTGLNEGEEFAQNEQLDELYRVEFLDVGYADCALVTNGEDSMLIDTGDHSDGKHIVEYLYTQDIDHLAVVICTNENPEHIGGLYTILSSLDVDTLILPMIETENAFLLECIQLAQKNGVTIKEVKAYDAWNIGEAQCLVLSANENAIIRIVVQETSFLFTSDATESELNALVEKAHLNEIDISADFLKAASHGAAGTSSDDFLRAVQPEYAIVSCDGDISEPNIKTMNRLYKRAIVYRTDDYDTVVVSTDGVYHELTTCKTNCDG